MRRNWLIAIREGKNVSQKNISEQIRVSQPSYSNIENGKRRPSVEVAKRIGTVLGFDWTLFFEEGGEKE